MCSTKIQSVDRKALREIENLLESEDNTNPSWKVTYISRFIRELLS